MAFQWLLPLKYGIQVALEPRRYESSFCSFGTFVVYVVCHDKRKCQLHANLYSRTADKPMGPLRPPGPLRRQTASGTFAAFQRLADFRSLLLSYLRELTK